MKTEKVFIAKEDDGTYSCYINEKSALPYGLVGEGSTVQEAVDEWNRAYSDMRELFKDLGREKEFVEVEWAFNYDVPSFLAYYGSLITYKGLAKLTGVSAAQLSQYASGYRHPSPKTTRKIQDGLRAFASELIQVSLV